MNILGHDAVRRYLAEGLKRDQLSPSLLFVGPDGVGKHACAVELAKSFVCETPSETAEFFRCDRCPACRRVDERNHGDVLDLDRKLQAVMLNEKPESQTAIKIESIRHADKFLHLRPSEGRRRVVIFAEAHKMTNDAANALLKLLEEPPNNAQLILVSVDEHSLPATVLSRCAVLRFRPAPAAVIAGWLRDRHSVDEERAHEIADRCGGSFERAVRLIEAEETAMDLSDYDAESFFALLNNTNWRRDGRKNAETAIAHLVELSQRKLEGGDLAQVPRLRAMLDARRQIDRNVPPRLALENLYVQIELDEKGRPLK